MFMAASCSKNMDVKSTTVMAASCYMWPTGRILCTTELVTKFDTMLNVVWLLFGYIMFKPMLDG